MRSKHLTAQPGADHEPGVLGDTACEHDLVEERDALIVLWRKLKTDLYLVKTELQQTKRDLQKADDEVRRLEETRLALEERYARTNEMLTQTNDTLTRVLNSRSWRATRILRAVAVRLRGHSLQTF